MKDEAKFTQVVRDNKSTIYTVCYMFSQDKDEVDELFQLTLINLWNGFESFRGDSKVETWIWRVALNTCLSSERKKKSTGTKVPLNVNIDLYADSDADSLQVQALRKRISKLGLIDRSIVLMWLENMSYDEIGAILGITPSNVGVKLLRIKEQLKKMSND
ncbi:MAG: sigma-70 family RNA polymerase sigma factor [Bacteroidales bacterium]|nr:sigma-70 family RNA polymerase sigma factor [Bacteroidales bacterium]